MSSSTSPSGWRPTWWHSWASSSPSWTLSFSRTTTGATGPIRMSPAHHPCRTGCGSWRRLISLSRTRWVSWVSLDLPLISTHAILPDGIDGKQARRIGLSGPLGELFDHGLDSYTAALIPACLYSIFGRVPPSVLPVSLLYHFSAVPSNRFLVILSCGCTTWSGWSSSTSSSRTGRSIWRACFTCPGATIWACGAPPLCSSSPVYWVMKCGRTWYLASPSDKSWRLYCTWLLCPVSRCVSTTFTCE